MQTDGFPLRILVMLACLAAAGLSLLIKAPKAKPAP